VHQCITSSLSSGSSHPFQRQTGEAAQEEKDLQITLNVFGQLMTVQYLASAQPWNNGSERPAATFELQPGATIWIVVVHYRATTSLADWHWWSWKSQTKILQFWISTVKNNGCNLSTARWMTTIFSRITYKKKRINRRKILHFKENRQSKYFWYIFNMYIGNTEDFLNIKKRM
jgi:hypothetical protein